MTTEPFVYIHSLNVRYGNKSVLADLSWTYHKGEHWVIGGKSGSGKSTLAKSIAQDKEAIQIAFDDNSPLKAVAFYVPNWYQFANLEGDRNFYYQQRYNHHQGEDTLTVRAEFRHFGEKENLPTERLIPIIQAMRFDALMDSQLIELSSGEHKKLQLIKALWFRPQLLFLDEPYTGLDKASREAFNNCLDQLVAEGAHLILITNDNCLPRSINRFAEIQNGKLIQVADISSFGRDIKRQNHLLPEFLRQKPSMVCDTIVKLRHVNVRYGAKTVLNDVSWEVKAGEKWVLQGPNGSGKSTLLSLINADHPQAYGHDISLFGQKRGSGESIWDIKEKIGIISPEMHWYFDTNATVWHTIASGFYDSIGWFIDVKFQEKKQIEELLSFFELTAVKDDLLTTLPLGKQRLALLARTIIKNPPLLVLDEPCQGLDNDQTQYFNDVVDELCQHGKTLIYVGHYESQLPQCVTHRIIIEKGEVINQGRIKTANELQLKI